ncbi:MAG: holin family protein [Bacteroidetes bacterium]|nr:holin family protein [Bacteroidota bacterium]
MGILNFLSGIVKPITDLIEGITTTDEERDKLKNELTKIENEFMSKALEYEGLLLESQSKIIQAEAAGQSWLQRSWRPITMLTFLLLVICDSFGLLSFRLNDEAWMLLKIGIGGYVIGRTGEKIVDKFRGKQ